MCGGGGVEVLCVCGGGGLQCARSTTACAAEHGGPGGGVFHTDDANGRDATSGDAGDARAPGSWAGPGRSPAHREGIPGTQSPEKASPDAPGGRRVFVRSVRSRTIAGGGRAVGRGTCPFLLGVGGRAEGVKGRRCSCH